VGFASDHLFTNHHIVSYTEITRNTIQSDTTQFCINPRREEMAKDDSYYARLQETTEQRRTLTFMAQQAAIFEQSTNRCINQENMSLTEWYLKHQEMIHDLQDYLDFFIEEEKTYIINEKNLRDILRRDRHLSFLDENILWNIQESLQAIKTCRRIFQKSKIFIKDHQEKIDTLKALQKIVGLKTLVLNQVFVEMIFENHIQKPVDYLIKNNPSKITELFRNLMRVSDRPLSFLLLPLSRDVYNFDTTTDDQSFALAVYTHNKDHVDIQIKPFTDGMNIPKTQIKKFINFGDLLADIDIHGPKTLTVAQKRRMDACYALSLKDEMTKPYDTITLYSQNQRLEKEKLVTIYGERPTMAHEATPLAGFPVPLDASHALHNVMIGVDMFNKGNMRADHGAAYFQIYCYLQKPGQKNFAWEKGPFVILSRMKP
jgi:hypothetical protein